MCTAVQIRSNVRIFVYSTFLSAIFEIYSRNEEELAEEHTVQAHNIFVKVIHLGTKVPVTMKTDAK
jgi:hypothetical protein